MAEKILLVEDNDDNRVIYRTILEHSGYGVIEAADGAEAVRLTREELPHLVLMDVSIPVLDGWEATRILKAERATAHIPVVALTAHALPADRERARQVGCDGYLAKPIEPRRVVEEVALQLRRSASGFAAAPTAEAAGRDDRMHPSAVLPEGLSERLKHVFGSGGDPVEAVTERALVHLPGLAWMVWEGDACTFQFTYVSDSAEQVLGYPSRRWTVEPAFWADTVVHPDDRDDAVAFCAVASGQGKDHAFEYRARHADGRIVWLHDSVRVLKGDRGVPVRLRGIMFDVTAWRPEAREAK